MPFLALLGDSIFDNGAYTAAGPAVVSQVRKVLPAEWRCELFAVDGSTTQDIADQLTRLPEGVTHVVLSCGGNDALAKEHLLHQPAQTMAQGLAFLAEATAEFELSYRRMLEATLKRGLPTVVCTIYHGNVGDEQPVHAQALRAAVTGFNDVIIRAAIDHCLRVIDLRLVCTAPEDYANPIEPSSVGGAKIARVIAGAVTGAGYAGPGAQVAA
jgi:hypothetical protein